MKTKKIYHPEVQRFLKGISNEVKRAIENSDFLFFVDKIRDEFKEFYMSAWTYAQIHKVEMNFSFEKFSDAKRLLKFMAANGQKRVGKVREAKESQLMVWGFERFEIKAHFKQKESACHYVKTGTKMVEVPIYELKCPEVIDPHFKAVESISEVDEDGLPL